MTSTTSKTTRSRWLLRSAAALLGAALLATPGLAEDSPDAIVRKTVDRVLEILASKDESEDQRRHRIEEIAYDRFDFATISQLVLARHWSRFSPEQRQEFVEQFKIHLSKNYGTRIMRYDQQRVAIVGQRVEPRGDVTVGTRIEGGSADGVEVDYRLRRLDQEKDGPWMVIDVIIEGVSLVSNYRSQFSEILGRGSPDDLLRQLREKNAASPA
jgi:phospholipid transport system substrate-binding protein